MKPHCPCCLKLLNPEEQSHSIEYQKYVASLEVRLIESLPSQWREDIADLYPNKDWPFSIEEYIDAEMAKLKDGK